MDHGPVYFIGGTFGGPAGSGWLIAIITATFTAGFTFLANLLLEDYRRHRDRRVFASVFSVDIREWLKGDEALQLEASFRRLHAELAAGHELPPVPAGLSSPRSIYEMCGDKVGLLDPEDAHDVVAFYSFAFGVQSAQGLATSPGPIAARAASLTSVLEAWPRERLAAQALVKRLEKVAGQLWRPFR
ncbi:MAG: hypothetical protein JO264_13870 [Acidisphaera sp.]|nr:hypothetical protein [Acidisphaera sp.]